MDGIKRNHMTYVVLTSLCSDVPLTLIVVLHEKENNTILEFSKLSSDLGE